MRKVVLMYVIIFDNVLYLMPIISSPGALLQVSLCHGLLSVVPLTSVICSSLPFHIFDISSRTISWSELKLVRGIVATLRFRTAKIVPF